MTIIPDAAQRRSGIGFGDGCFPQFRSSAQIERNRFRVPRGRAAPERQHESHSGASPCLAREATRSRDQLILNSAGFHAPLA